MAEHLQAAWPHAHRARLKGVAIALLGLIVASSVNLTKVARACAGPAQVGSHYRRLQRLLAGFALLGGDGPLAPVLAALSGVLPPWDLSLDRTTWQPCAVAGPRLPWINFLVLAIVHDGVAYPLFWTLLPKKGNSSVAERIALFEPFLAQFGPGAVRSLCMDREFGARRWLAWLQARKISYRARLCIEHRLSNARGDAVRLRHLCAHLTPGQPERWTGRDLWGLAVDVAVVRIPPEVCARSQAAKWAKGHRRSGDELVVVVAPADPARAAADVATAPALLSDYRQRWGIETFFGALKSRGFDLETTRVVRYAQRLERLVGLLALAFTWAHRTGQWVAAHVRGPRFHARRDRRAKSLFRHGQDYLCHLLAPGATNDPRRQDSFSQLLAFFVMC